MSDSNLKYCPTCGAALDAEGVSGCPRCLMLAAMQPTAHPEGAERTPSPSLAAVSAAFPQLEVLELIGQGGMGCVFKARQPQLNRFVALKILPEALSRDAAFAARFTREAQALAALSHPNIVTIHDFGQARSGDAEAAAPGLFYLLMEFVDGVNLRQALSGGHFTPEQALAIVPPLCDALQFAHERGIVHRDIKPENLLLDKAGRIKIADFGVARMLAASGAANSPPPAPGAATNSPAENPPPPSFVTADNAISGTPGYMAPEQKATPQKVDSRADIYSLGVVFYEMLTGELPADKLQPPSRKVQIDVRLDEIVLRALEKTPELRYQTAAELRTHVETMVGTSPPGSGNRAGATGTNVLSPLCLKVGSSTLVTRAWLATARGQFLAYRTRGQLVLDDRHLTHTAPPALASAITVIPLAIIRDVSIGQYPRSMNPLGIDLLSVTYEEDGQRKQVLLSPMEGHFAMPRTWNARAAEWAEAIREAVTAATGRAPTTTPSDQLGVPGSHLVLLTMFLMPLVPVGVFLTCLTALIYPPGVYRLHTGLISLFVFGMAAFLFFWWFFTHSHRANSPPGSARTLSPRRQGGTAGKVVALVVAVPFLLLVLAVAALVVWRKAASDFGPGVGLVRLSPADEMLLESSHPLPAQQHPPGEVQQTQNGFRLTLPASQLATFEFSIRQADDSWQPVPSLTALIATGEGGSYRDSLWWTLRRGNDANLTNQLWFWTVTANEAGGHPQPQLADHGTNFTHHVPHSETLDWWHLAVPPQITMTPGTEQTLTLFRTFGTATARGEQLKEARIRIRCEPLPAGLPVSAAQHLVQAGLAAHALLERFLPANVKREPGLSNSLPAEAPAPNIATPQTAPDSSERATEPLALFTPVIDPSLGDVSYRLVSTLVQPRQVVVAEVALVDDQYSTAHTISQLGFYLASADGTANASARVTWSIENVTKGEGAWIVRVGGEGSGSKFERVARLGSRNKGFADILVAPGQPENPDRGAETSLDDATTTWVAVRPERSHWVGPGEWNVGEWNSLTLFEARDDKGKVQRRLRLKLLVRPMLADANVPWNGTLLRKGYWSQDQTLRDLIGGPPAFLPKAETPQVVPDPKPATRPEVPKAAISAGTPTEPVSASKAGADNQQPNKAYQKVGVPTATLAATLTNWSAELNGLRLGLRLPETPEWRIGGQVGVELWVSNRGAKEVKFGHSPRTDAGLSVIARDKGGKDYRAEITQYRGYFTTVRILVPQHQLVTG